jgi:hypothetical protein
MLLCSRLVYDATSEHRPHCLCQGQNAAPMQSLSTATMHYMVVTFPEFGSIWALGLDKNSDWLRLHDSRRPAANTQHQLKQRQGKQA